MVAELGRDAGARGLGGLTGPRPRCCPTRRHDTIYEEVFAVRSQRRAGTLLTTVVALAACGSPEADIPVEEDVPVEEVRTTIGESIRTEDDARVEDVVLHKAGEATVLADSTWARLEEMGSGE